MTRSVWIEVALNGASGRARQPGIPISVDEIVSDALACAQDGAAIIHLHAYDAETGVQNDDWATYARIIERVRAKCDAIVYPTVPAFAYPDRARYAHIAELGARGLLEWTVCDPGSATIARYDDLAQAGPGFVYSNSIADIAEGLALSRRFDLHPGYAIYEPGFTRLGAALAARVAGLKSPIFRFMFSSEFAWGFPPRENYLEAHVALVDECAPRAPWMVAGLGVDIRPLIAPAVAMGGHVRVGLEDAPYCSPLTNRQWTRAAANALRACGAAPASPADVRAQLAALPLSKGAPNA